MLEVNNFVYLGNVSPFLGAVIDICSTKSNVDPVATGSTQYVKLNNHLFRRKRHPEWISLELRYFELSTWTLIKKSVDLFEAYQTLALRTETWHMVNHLTYDLSRMCDISYIMADFYETVEK